jgi:tRNA(Arg) A34 adenosine deaminase TadA
MSASVTRPAIKEEWLDRVSFLSDQNVSSGRGGPFAAIVIKDGEIIAESCNEVLVSGDPTAHAEVSVIRKACKVLGSFQLENCILITSCEPCPMCLGAIYWARPNFVVYVNSREDAAEIGFGDQFIYDEINVVPSERSIPCLKIDFPKAKDAFRHWTEKTDRINY